MIAQLDADFLRIRPTKGVVRLLSYALFEGRPATTRGRFINPLVFGLNRLWKGLPQLKQVRQPVFILGTGRSGTTLLGTLLGMHRDVGYLNEPKALWHSAYPGEDVIGSYCQGEASYRLGAEAATDEVRGAAHKLFGAYLRTTMCSRVVDKYPELVFRVPFVRAIFPDAKFIFIVRNAVDTCISIRKWSDRKGVTSASVDGAKGPEVVEDWWGVNGRKWELLLEQVAAKDELLGPKLETLRGLTDQSHMALVEWVLSMQEGLMHTKRDPQSVRLVRYEDLTANPVAELERLQAFCELERDPNVAEYATRRIRPASRHSDALDIPGVLQPSVDALMERLGYGAQRSDS